MDDKAHLPTAASLPSSDALTDLDVGSVYAMAEECSRWLRDAAAYQASIVTPAARTLWAALAQEEVDHVAETYDHLLAEIDRRVSSSNEGA